MAAELKPYPAYRVSGVEALGKVPAQWEVRRLRTIAEMRVSNIDKHSRDGEWPVRLCNYVDVYKADRIQTGMPLMPATATSEEIERFRLLPGDVLITKDSEAWNDIGVPALVEGATDDTVCGYHLALLRPLSRCVSGGFLFRAVQSSAVAYQFHVRANGVTRYGLTHNGIKSTWLPVPPLAEQTAIVRFLDHVYRRIQRYIHAKERLIALLEEQRQIVVHEAVTGRIDVRTGRPYPAYKHSGVEWLGRVPEHWHVSRLGALLRERGEMNDDGRISEVLSVVRGRGVIPYAEKGNIGNKKSEDITRYKIVRPDDIVVNCMNVIIGSVGLSRYTGCLSPVYYVLTRRSKSDHPQYLNSYFQTKPFQESLVRIGNGILAHRMRIPMELLKCEPFPRPSFDEQATIVSFLDDTTRNIDAAVAGTHHQIESVREYRTRLIADVVTGKVDVRKAAARLPDVDPLSAESDPVDGVDHDAGSAWTDRRPTEEAGAPVGAGQ